MRESDNAKCPTANAVATDAYLASVTAGTLEPLNASVALTPCDPDWPAEIARHAHLIREGLGKKVLLEHVGSTSVPGLSAKPVIDIVLAVADSADEAAYVPALERIRYTLQIREPDWCEHRLLATPDGCCNLPVFRFGCAAIGRMRAFRDWLRTDDDDRRLYQETKRALLEPSS